METPLTLERETHVGDGDGLERTQGVTWHLLLLVLISSVALFSRFLKGDRYWMYFEDDFFYYAQVAKQLATSHVSSFDGVHLTNGYHPLWLVVLTLLYKTFPGIAFFVAVQGVGLIASVVLYFAALRCLTYFGLVRPLIPLAALTFSLHALLLFRYGMEVTLALPLAFLTLAYIVKPSFRWTPRQSLFYGFLSSLTVLARLDAIFLFLLLLIAQFSVSEASLPQKIKRLTLYGAGGFLFVVYVATNVYFFHALLPVSGAAKQMKPLLPPSMLPVTHFLVHPDFVKAAFAYPAILVGLIGAYVVVSRRPRNARILAALLLFPVVHLAEMCLLSDWHIWPWYYYSLSFAAFAGMVALLEGRVVPDRVSNNRLILARTAMYAMVVMLCGYVAAYSVGKKPPMFAVFGGFVADFARQHPGTYAMGDCSGSAGYRSDQPFVQLEGLMMDKPYLHWIRARTPLAEVLKTYHADYYATIQNPTDRHGCFVVVEPRQAGPRSPHMMGRICAEPLASTNAGGQSVGIFRASDVLMP